MRRTAFLLPALFAILVGASPAHAWTWPVDGPVLQPFSLGDDPYAAGYHRGVDVAAPAGSPVRAPAGGTVTFAGTVPRGGRTLTIRTADGYAVRLLHLGTFAVGRGESVREGDVVAAVGPSGEVEHPEPYVHLGVRIASERDGYVDPLSLLPARDAAVPAPNAGSEDGDEAADSTTPPTDVVPAEEGETTPANGEIVSAEPAEDGAQPDGEVAEPAEEPTEPSDQVTEPAADVTERVDEATESADDIVQPDELTEPVDQVTAPAGEVAEPVADAAEPVEEPAETPGAVAVEKRSRTRTSPRNRRAADRAPADAHALSAGKAKGTTGRSVSSGRSVVETPPATSEASGNRNAQAASRGPRALRRGGPPEEGCACRPDAGRGTGDVPVGPPVQAAKRGERDPLWLYALGGLAVLALACGGVLTRRRRNGSGGRAPSPDTGLATDLQRRVRDHGSSRASPTTTTDACATSSVGEWFEDGTYDPRAAHPALLGLPAGRRAGREAPCRRGRRPRPDDRPRLRRRAVLRR